MIVLDTHALIWWVSDPKRIPPKATRLIKAAIGGGEPIAVSSISMWEIALLVANNRLTLTMDADAWIERVQSLAFLVFVPVDNEIAVRSVQLENFPHRDPADRMIVATALGLGATLITADARLQAYRAVKTAWS